MARAKPASGKLTSKHPLVRRVERFLGDQRLVTRGDRVLVAVSGGADSVFLLRSLVALAGPRGFDVVAAHFDHRWRGAESAADAAFVASLAAELGVAHHMGAAARAARRTLSPEEAARGARYRFLAQVARSEGAIVATGHTWDDQIETYLLGWLRGSGPAGASLMRSDTTLPAPGARGLRLIRPLLTLGRQEIRQALEASGQTWREDRTNDDLRFLRNRVRKELLPLLESLAPGARHTIVRAASLSRDAADYLEQSAAGAAKRVFRRELGALTASRAAFLEVDPALRAAVLQRAVERVAGSARDVESAHLQAALGLIERGAGARRTVLGPRVQLALSRGEIRLSRRPPDGDESG